jgi:hypothetical protein
VGTPDESVALLPDGDTLRVRTRDGSWTLEVPPEAAVEPVEWLRALRELAAMPRET